MGRSRTPKNVPGAFYVVDGCCTACGVPDAFAPDLFAFDAGTKEEGLRKFSRYPGWFLSRNAGRKAELFSGRGGGFSRILFTTESTESTEIRREGRLSPWISVPVVKELRDFFLRAADKIHSANHLDTTGSKGITRDPCCHEQHDHQRLRCARAG